MSMKSQQRRERLRTIIFGTGTPAGKAFDVGLLALIIASVLAVVLESVSWIREDYGSWLHTFEWVVTISFTIEYVLRLYCVNKPWRYARSFFGVVDLLAILPTYLSIFIPGAQSLLVIRALRLLRVFRVLKLVHFVGEASQLRVALQASLRKIIVFLGAVLALTVIVGSAMYLIEGEENGFLYRGIATRSFERRFNLADHVRVTGARLDNGLLHIELEREIPEAMKPRSIEIQSSGALLEGTPEEKAA